MKYVIDATILLVIARGHRAPIEQLSWYRPVTAKLLALGRTDLDAVTAAHALALDAHVLTTDPGRYAWVDGLRAEVISPGV